MLFKTLKSRKKVHTFRGLLQNIDGFNIFGKLEHESTSDISYFVVVKWIFK